MRGTEEIGLRIHGGGDVASVVFTPLSLKHLYRSLMRLGGGCASKSYCRENHEKRFEATDFGAKLTRNLLVSSLPRVYVRFALLLSS